MALIGKPKINGDLRERVPGTFDLPFGLMDAKCPQIRTNAHPYAATECPAQANWIDIDEIPELGQRPGTARIVMQSFAYDVHPRRSRSLRSIVPPQSCKQLERDAMRRERGPSVASLNFVAEVSGERVYRRDDAWVSRRRRQRCCESAVFKRNTHVKPARASVSIAVRLVRITDDD